MLVIRKVGGKTMRVALYARHWGLIDLMYGVLKHHDVRLQEPWEGHQTHRGDEDIVISTFAYQDINNFREKFRQT